MNKLILFKKLVTVSLLIAFLTQLVLASPNMGMRNSDTLKHSFVSKKAMNMLNPLYYLPKLTITQELPKGFINPAKISKGNINKSIAFIPSQCNEKWKGKKLKIVQEDKDLLAKNLIEISENADFLETNAKRCKAIVNIDIHESTKSGIYKIRFYPDNTQSEVIEAILEVTEKEANQSVTNTNSANSVGQNKEENGITVGKPKQFDERTLTLMLQGLESKLAQTQFPDTGGLYGNIGRFGGATANTTSMALSVKGPSMPSITTTLGSGTKDTTNSSTLEEGTETTTVNSDGTTIITGGKTSNTNGNISEATSNNQQVITQAAIVPPTVGLPSQTSIYSYQPQFGIASQDLLAEQTSLFYQIANLRLLLDRSITDRIKVQPGSGGSFATADIRRNQVVIGFQISIDATYKDAVAEAEVTIEGQDVSLVSLLPQEKTYNVASVTKDSKAIDVGAVVQFIGVGGTAGKTQESMYLVKDTDTVALERKSTGNNTKFAWQFRPVLGRKTVEPGVRQVYALISVPNILANKGAWAGTVTSTTSWRHYNRKTKTVGNVIKRTSKNIQYDKFELPIGNSNLIESGLKPTVSSLNISDVGNGQVLINVQGEGFTPDTVIVVGNKIINRPEDGLTIANERRLMVLASSQILAQTTSPPLIVGRYGTTNFERFSCFNYPGQSECTPTEEPYFGRLLEKVTIKPRDAVNSEVTILLVSDKEYFDNKVEKKKDRIENFDYLFKNHPPVVIIGSKVFGFSDSPFISKKYTDTNNPASFPSCPTDKYCAELTFVAPKQLLANNTFLTFKEFLWNKGNLTINLPPQDNFTVLGLTTLGSNDEKTQLAISGGGFTDQVKIFVGDTEFKLNCEATEPTCNKLNLNLASDVTTATFITLSPTKAQIKGVKQILIMQGTAQPQILALTTPPATVPKAKIISPSPLIIPVGNSRREKLAGANLESLKKITMLDGKELIFKLDEKDKTVLFLEIPESLTNRAGEKQIKLIMKDDEDELFTIIVK